jgi:hypothetical protein
MTNQKTTENSPNVKNKLTLIGLVFLLFLSCGQKQKQSSSADTTTANSGTDLIEAENSTKEAENSTDLDADLSDADANAATDSIVSSSEAGKSLNDIRFGNWTDKDWRDNDYFRFLRKQFDACYNGKIKDSNLEPYKSLLKGKFVIFDAQPYMMGGMLIYLTFVDEPDKIFRTSVYSEVDETTETVSNNFSLGGFFLHADSTETTKNDLLEFLKEYPENKLW